MKIKLDFYVLRTIIRVNEKKEMKMIKQRLMSFTGIALILLRYRGVMGLLSYLFPVTWYKGQALFMLPCFYNGYFSMKSINRVK